MRSGVLSPSTPPTFKQLYQAAFFFGINLSINLIHIPAFLFETEHSVRVANIGMF